MFLQTLGGHCFLAVGDILWVYSWENPLFLWPFFIAMINYRRVSTNPKHTLQFPARFHARKQLGAAGGAACAMLGASLMVGFHKKNNAQCIMILHYGIIHLLFRFIRNLKKDEIRVWKTSTI